jgi:hypothetical protein
MNWFSRLDVENVLNDADVNVLTRDDSAAQLTAQLTAGMYPMLV